MTPKVAEVEDGDFVVFYYDGPEQISGTYSIKVRDVIHDLENNEVVALISENSIAYEAKHIYVSSINPYTEYFDPDFT
jgi:hypothetical protein